MKKISTDRNYTEKKQVRLINKSGQQPFSYFRDCRTLLKSRLRSSLQTIYLTQNQWTSEKHCKRQNQVATAIMKRLYACLALAFLP